MYEGINDRLNEWKLIVLLFGYDYIPLTIERAELVDWTLKRNGL